MPSHYGTSVLGALRASERALSPAVGGEQPRFRDRFGDMSPIGIEDFFRGQQARRQLVNMGGMWRPGAGALAALAGSKGFQSGLGPMGNVPGNFWRLHSTIANRGLASGFAPGGVADVAGAIEAARQNLDRVLQGSNEQDAAAATNFRGALGFGPQAARQMLALARLSGGHRGNNQAFLNALYSTNPNVTVRL